MENYKNSGDRLTLTAPSGGVTSGSGVKIGQLFVVAEADADEGDSFVGLCTGTFTLPKTSAQAWTEGALLYWDPSPGEVTTATTAGNLLIGVAAAVAADPSSTGTVRLSGHPQADQS